MTPSELKELVEARGSKFFSSANMRFAGDTMANYGVASCRLKTRNGDIVDAWCLYRKKAVKHGLKKSAYFDKQPPHDQRFGEEV